MKDRQKGTAKKTLRNVLCEYYAEMIKEHDKVAKKRFPHYADPNSKSSKNTYPSSFKLYFFKLVKNLIVNNKGQKVLAKNPASLVMAVGAR